ncbi:MAG TPA: DoxX family protein [Gemmata sp.]
MNLSPTLSAVVYAGLFGTLLSLIVATVTNKWSPRVFFLLALRLAIGWHFMFEGFHKIHSHYTGPTDTNRVFSSEPYFKVAPGPLGAMMRKGFSDPAAEIAAKVKAPKSISSADFAKMSIDEQAAECPEPVAKQLNALEENAKETVKAEATKELKDADDTETKAVKGATAAEAVLASVPFAAGAAKEKAGAARAKAKADADKARAAANKKLEAYATLGAEMVTDAKAAYARWVYGVDPRPMQVKTITGEVMFTGPQRLEYLDWVRNQAQAIASHQANGLGNGTGTDSKRVAEFRTGAVTAEADLARDANAFIAELKKELNGGTAVEEKVEPSRGQRLDKVTMWFLVVVGACVMFGLFTRVACVLSAGFLVMTYLAHPAFPWYPLPPNTEGNPVFINKNVIEALALLTLACYPTGRWLGLDALVLRPFLKYKGERPA